MNINKLYFLYEIIFINKNNYGAPTNILHLTDCDNEILLDNTKYLPLCSDFISNTSSNLDDYATFNINLAHYNQIKTWLHPMDDPAIFINARIKIHSVCISHNVMSEQNIQKKEEVFLMRCTEAKRSQSIFTLKCTPHFMDILTTPIGSTWSTQCNAKFGDTRCGVDLSKYKTKAKITKVNNLEVEIEYINLSKSILDSLQTQNNIYILQNGGRFCASNQTKAYANKQSSNSDKILMSYVLHEDYIKPQPTSGVCEVIPGCNKTLDSCKLYNNCRNYKGFASLEDQK